MGRQLFADEFNRLRLNPETYTDSLTNAKNELKKYPYRRDVCKAIDQMVSEFNNKKEQKVTSCYSLAWTITRCF